MPGLASQGAPPPIAPTIVDDVINSANLTTTNEVLYEDRIKAFHFLFEAVGELDANTRGTIRLEFEDVLGNWINMIVLDYYGYGLNDEIPCFILSEGGYWRRNATGGTASLYLSPLSTGLGDAAYGADVPLKFPLHFRMIVSLAFSGPAVDIRIYMTYVKES